MPRIVSRSWLLVLILTGCVGIVDSLHAQEVDTVRIITSRQNRNSVEDTLPVEQSSKPVRYAIGFFYASVSLGSKQKETSLGGHFRIGIHEQQNVIAPVIRLTFVLPYSSVNILDASAGISIARIVQILAGVSSVAVVNNDGHTLGVRDGTYSGIFIGSGLNAGGFFAEFDYLFHNLGKPASLPDISTNVPSFTIIVRFGWNIWF